MICDYQTNKVYLAQGIKGYPKVAENLLYALYKEGIETEYLPHSKSKKHVWARDYMPIQLEENLFLKYVYNPDYLKPAEIAKELGWPADKVHRTVCREKKKLEKI